MKPQAFYDAALNEVVRAIASGSPHYDMQALTHYATGLAEDAEERLGEPNFGANQDAAQQLDQDVRAAFDDRGKGRQAVHSLRIHMSELFSTGDASADVVSNGVSIGMSFVPAGQVGGALVGALVSTVSGEVSGRLGDAAADQARARRKRAERTDNFREVMQSLDLALGEAQKSLGSSTWHFRKAAKNREWLTKEFKSLARNKHFDHFGPVNQKWFQSTKSAEKKAEEQEEYYVYKLASYLHHEEKARRSLLPILGAYVAVQSRVRVWRYFWDDAGIDEKDKPPLSGYASILDGVEGTNHQRCGQEEVCYKSSGFVSILDSDPVERVRPISKGTTKLPKDLGVAKEQMRGRKKPSQQDVDSERAGLLDHAADDDPAEFLDGTRPDEQFERHVGAELTEPALYDEGIQTDTFPWQAGLALVTPHKYDPEKWHKQEKPTGDEDWYAEAGAVGRRHPRTEGWCHACRRDVSWLLFQAYCKVEGKTRAEQAARRAGRKLKNADKKQMVINAGAVAVGLGVSIGTFGLATPIGIGAGLAIAATSKAASTAAQEGRLRQLIEENSKRASRSQSSRSGGGDSKAEIKLDHEMIRKFSVKVRRHFKACEEAFRRMRVLVRGSQDDFGSSSGTMDSCFDAARYVWAAQKFRHHHEKLQVYLLPFELYATSLLRTLDQWEKEWTPGTNEYNEARLDEPGGVTFGDYVDVFLRHHQCEHNRPSHATLGTGLTLSRWGSDIDLLVDELVRLEDDDDDSSDDGSVLYIGFGDSDWDEEGSDEDDWDNDSSDDGEVIYV